MSGSFQGFGISVRTAALSAAVAALALMVKLTALDPYDVVQPRAIESPNTPKPDIGIFLTIVATSANKAVITA